MSLVFSNTTTKNGIIQVIERNCGFNDGDISGNALLLAQFTGMCNIALDDTIALILKTGGKWQFDDSNYTEFPSITTNLVQGQREYTFIADANSNLILDIYKVMLKDTNGIYFELDPIDQQSDEATESFWSGQNVSGIPSKYDKTGKFVSLDVLPSYNSTAGLKLFINREGSYFLVSDTTKKPGIAGSLHEYIPLKASYTYARDKSLPVVTRLERDVLLFEEKIRNHYGRRARDERQIMSGETVCSV